MASAGARTLQLDVSALDAVNGGADNAFSFIGAGAFTGIAGQLHYVVSLGAVTVEGDTNGDAIADFHLVVDGVASLAVSDFWL
jgi:hypothetical protein